MVLSNLAVSRAKATGKAYTLPDSEGLSLAVSAKGRKSWHFRYYLLLAPKRMSLGTYPEVSLREARSLRDEARALVAKGINPRIERAQKRAAVQLADQHTFEVMFRQWHAHRSLSLKHGRQTALSQVERVFAKDVLPALGKRSIYDIKRHDLLQVLARIERRKAHSVAKKVRSWFNQLFRYALVKVHGLEHNPASDLDVVAMPQPPVRNNPFLRMEQLPAFLKALRNYPGRLQTQLGLRLILLTGVRTGELRQATPDQFDLDRGLWVIPVEVVKQLQVQMRRRGRRQQQIPPYVVPLSVQAMEIVRHMLEQVKPAQRHLFPHDWDLKKRISENTLNAALKRMGYDDVLTGHGIRATISTALNEVGYPRIWVDAQLSHADPNRVSATYNHADYVEPRRRMMQDWADRLDLFEQERIEEASLHRPVSLHGLPARARTDGADSVMTLAPTSAGAGPDGDAIAPAPPSAVARLHAVCPPLAALQPELSDAQRERLARMAIFNSPRTLRAAVFAEAVGKSRRWISYEIQAGKLLALSMGNRGQRVPDWHLDPVKHNLIQVVLTFAPNADCWRVYDALSSPNQMLDGRAPIDAVRRENFHDAAMAASLALKDVDPFPGVSAGGNHRSGASLS